MSLMHGIRWIGMKSSFAAQKSNQISQPARYISQVVLHTAQGCWCYYRGACKRSHSGALYLPLTCKGFLLQCALRFFGGVELEQEQHCF